MKSVAEGTFFQTVEEIAPLWKELLEQEGIEEQINTIIRYLVETVKESPEKIRDSITQVTNPQIGEKVMTAAEELRSEGRNEGRNEGMILLTSDQLRTKFREEAENWLPKLAKFSQESLRKVSQRILFENDLEKIFENLEPKTS